MALLPFQNCSPGFKVSSQTDLSSLFSTEALNQKDAYGVSGLRRLTQFELTRSVADIFGVAATTYAGDLPSDDRTTIPFSNEYGSQAIAPITIQNYQTFAEEYANAVVSQPGFAAKFTQIAGCTPKSVSDRDCFLIFVNKIGRRMLRRPVLAAEADFYATTFLPIATAEANFNSAVELAIQAWIQSPEFLYKIESGNGFQAQAGMVALSEFQIATRLSYLIWGSTPDETLLNEAQAGRLSLADNRVTQTLRMLNDPKAKAQWEHFHAEWMGYDSAILPSNLAADMNLETNQLVDKVVFDQNSDWMDLFRAKETYLTPALAQHYGMGQLPAAKWVLYTGQRGGGILAHATLLSQGAKFGDTSPTLRGYNIFKKLMCGQLGEIPASVDIDNPPGVPGDCKEKRYNMRSLTSCAGCHQIIDNIGFGLENFGVTGDWRTTEPGLPNCSIVNNGSVDGVPFSGPAALGVQISNNPKVSQCAVTQLFRFMSGRHEEQADMPTLNALNNEYLGKRSLKLLMLSLVQSPAFANRVLVQ